MDAKECDTDDRMHVQGKKTTTTTTTTTGKLVSLACCPAGLADAYQTTRTYYYRNKYSTMIMHN